MEKDEDVDDLDFFEIGVYVAFPLTERYTEASEEERCSGDFAEWDSQYDTEAPEIWAVGDRLPKEFGEYPRIYL